MDRSPFLRRLCICLLVVPSASFEADEWGHDGHAGLSSLVGHPHGARTGYSLCLRCPTAWPSFGTKRRGPSSDAKPSETHTIYETSNRSFKSL